MNIRKIVEERRVLPNRNIYLLTLDEPVIVRSAEEDYRNFRIDGKLYKPVPMSGQFLKIKFISVEGEGNFVGKEVEFTKDEISFSENIAV